MIWSPSTYTGWPENYFHADENSLYDYTVTANRKSSMIPHVNCISDQEDSLHVKRRKKQLKNAGIWSMLPFFLNMNEALAHWPSLRILLDHSVNTEVFTECSMPYSSIKFNVSNLFTLCHTELKNVIKATSSFSADQTKGRGTSQQASGTCYCTKVSLLG